MHKVSTKGYEELLKDCYDAKIPLYVYGGVGVGKSSIPRQTFKGVADSQVGRKFVEWSNLFPKERIECITHPENFFVLCDQRVAQMDISSLQGVPNLLNKDLLELIPFSWIVYFTQPKASGVIFFDELNLAPPTVAGQAYQIINDRVIADRRLADDVWVFGAGNRPEDNANVYEMSFPLRDRFCEVEVEHNKDEWTVWASGKVNPHLVAFVNWKPSYLYKINENSQIKNTTPRGIERASILVGQKNILDKESLSLIKISVGEAWATEFEAYCKHYQSLDFKKIYKNPASIKDFDLNKMWALIGGMSEHFQNKQTKEIFNDVFPVCVELAKVKPDMGVVALRMIRAVNDKKFVEFALAHDKIDDLDKKIGKFIYGG